MKRILLLDDEVNVLQALRRTIRGIFPNEVFHVELFSDPEQALLRMGEYPFHVVVSDYWMPGMNGIDFLRMAKGIQPEAVRLVLSASTEFSTVMEAINKAEAFRFIAKPWVNAQIKEVLLLAFERSDKSVAERRIADESRLKKGILSPQEFDARWLEEEEPGILKVNWDTDGAVRLHDEDE